MKLGGYQIIDLSGASYIEEDDMFVLPSDAGFEKILKTLKSTDKVVLVTGMPTSDNSAVVRDSFATVTYDVNDGEITEIYLTSIERIATINADNELYIREFIVPTGMADEDGEDSEARLYIGGKTLTIAVNTADDSMTISFDGVSKSIE